MLGVFLVFGFKIILSCFLFDEESDNDFPSHSLFPNKISCKRLVHRFTRTAVMRKFAVAQSFLYYLEKF